MLIGIADRKDLIARCDLSTLRKHGVTTVERYVSFRNDNFFISDQLRASNDAGLDTVVHVTDEPIDDLEQFVVFLNAHQKAYSLGDVHGLVMHPCEKYRDAHGYQINKVTTGVLLKIVKEELPSDRNARSEVFLENLPFDPNAYWRAGSNLGEIANMLNSTGEDTFEFCLDTGRYLMGKILWENDPCRYAAAAHDQDFRGLSPWLMDRIGHIHIHSLPGGKEHQPLQDDDGRLRELVAEVVQQQGNYTGVWSILIDVDPLSSVAQTASTVLKSIETLQSWL